MDMKKIDKKKLRDFMAKGGIVLVFAMIIYYAFSSEDAAEKNIVSGLNTELPDGKSEPLADKMKAYENRSLDESKMKSLDDYLFSLKASKETGQESGGKFDVELKDSQNELEEIAGVQALKASISRKEDPISEWEYNQLAKEKAELEAKLYKMEKNKNKNNDMDEQLEVMEKSYALAAKYMGGAQAKSQEGAVPSNPENNPSESERVDISKKGNNVVSTLSEELLLDAPYNYGFNTAVGSGYQVGTNTIRAAVSEDQAVTAGQRVKLRLLEPLQAGNVTVPRNHLIAGSTNIQGDRMNIQIESIEYEGNIIPVRMRVYDTDGMPGIYCPSSLEQDALREGAANIGSGLGSSISFAQSAGQQIVMDVTRGVMNGASQYMSKKLRTVKVTLKSNYEVLLLPQKK